MKKIISLSILFIFSLSSRAQSYCTPSYTVGTSNGDYIAGLDLADIYNMGLNAAGAASYIDTNAALSTTLYANKYYFLEIKTGTQGNDQNYAVFIDFNGDGDFFDPKEAILQFPKTVGAGSHTLRCSFQVLFNVNAISSRLRIVSVRDTASNLIVRACGNYQYGQTQDFKINFQTQQPYTFCAGADTLRNCHGTISDGSGPAANYNNGQSCQWLIIASNYTQHVKLSFTQMATEFGYDRVFVYDGNNSFDPLLGNYSGTTLPPIITSSGPSLFVEFFTNNGTTAAGWSANYDCVSDPYCTVLQSGCGANYISNTTIYETPLNYTSSCDTFNSAYSNTYKGASLEKGRTYTLGVTETVGNSGVNTWIDYDQSNTFEASEWVSAQSQTLPNGLQKSTFTVPATALSGTTKMRVRAGSHFGAGGTIACTQFFGGETEDYSIDIIQAADSAPVADFSTTFTTLNAGENTSFKDLSSNAPSSWYWSFPGAVTTSSTLKNPSNIVYNTPGCYAVTLKVVNGAGSDSITRSCYITVTAAGSTYCNPNPTIGVGSSYINGVHLNSLNNLNTGNNNNAVYTFYPSPITDVALTINSLLTIYTGADNSDYYAAWIDYNNDNDFNDANEKLGQVTNVLANSSTTITFSVPSGTSLGNKRMRIRNAHTSNSGSIIDPCLGYYYGETEDYTVNIITAFPAPVADFTASATSISANSSVNFTDLSSNAPTSWQWTFTGGTPSTSTLQNPSNILYSAPGCYPVQLIAISSNGRDTLKRTCYIDVAPIPPIADFVANTTTFLLNGSANFTDQSSNTPTSWEWTFYGATPSTSTNQNPSNISYSAVNCYDVKLKVNNAAGSDSITKTCYINVVGAPSPCSELFFSEYLEATANDKALEIYNPSSSSVNLTGYSIELYPNGGTTPNSTYNFTGSLAAHGVFVLANSGSNATIQNSADALSSVCNFNGNDALVLKKNGIVLDAIGVVGVNPGLSWTVGSGSTADHTLTRKITVSLPENSWTNAQSQWDVYPLGTTTYLGANTNNCSISGNPANASFTVSNPTCVDLPTLFTNTSSNATSYNWTFNGATPQSSTLASPAATWLTSGVYQVTLIASNSLYSDTVTETITINDNPALPVISQIGNTLESTPALSYEWYLANVLIPGATSQQYTPTQNGQYRVKVTNASGCWTTSLNFNYTSVGVTELGNSNSEIKVVPNPFTERISLETNSKMLGEQYNMIDKLGREVKSGTIEGLVNELDLSALPSGIYLLQVKSQHIKLLKQ